MDYITLLETLSIMHITFHRDSFFTRMKGKMCIQLITLVSWLAASKKQSCYYGLLEGKLAYLFLQQDSSAAGTTYKLGPFGEQITSSLGRNEATDSGGALLYFFVIILCDALYCFIPKHEHIHELILVRIYNSMTLQDDGLNKYR